MIHYPFTVDATFISQNFMLRACRSLKQTIWTAKSLIALLTLLSCAPTDASPGSQAATRSIIRNGLINVPEESIFTRKTLFNFGLPYLTATQLQQTGAGCDGAAGSVSPPLTAECMADALVAPVEVPLKFLERALGAKDHTNEVDLPGAQRVWVQQSRPNDCWAATLQMARDYLGLPHIEQSQILAASAKLCPALAQQDQGADLFQITYVSRALFRRTDAARALAKPCGDGTCIISSLSQRHPVIMLKNGHATLIVGADYGAASGKAMIDRVRVLDPADETGQIKTVPFYQLCSADAFIAY